MSRTFVLLALLAAYITATVRPTISAGSVRDFDALAPDSRFVEQAIGERQFGHALPVALELRRAHPGEPLAAYWLATIYQGLGRTADARVAWDDFQRLSGSAGGTNAD